MVSRTETTSQSKTGGVTIVSVNIKSLGSASGGQIPNTKDAP